VLERRGRFLVAEPLFARGARPAIDSRDLHGGKPGDLVLAGPGKRRAARVLRVIGRPDVARHVLEGLMLDRGLRGAFPRSVEAEAERMTDHPVAADARVDLTDLPTFTIDPDTARDFDDAISAERRDDGRIRLWVHIADVSAFVRPGAAVEKEAYRRGTSVYVPGAVEPMLPEALSNRACSLVPGEERLAVTGEMDMDGTQVVRVAFHRSRIRSDARLTYGQVDEVLAGRERPQDPWGEPLAAAREVAAALRARRESRGALEVDSREPQYEFGDDGQVTGVDFEEQTESHELIEHLMILANEQVAGYLSERKLPTLYRVHERPDPNAVEFVLQQLESLDVPTPAAPEHMSPQQAADVAAEASRLVAGHVRRTGHGRALTSLVLRSLKQAYYSPRNAGHAGLASATYCHFTSPIRRYPDLVAHRALLAGLGIDDAAPRNHELEETGVATSAAEREAMSIERSADDVCSAFLLKRSLGEQGAEPPAFAGEVVGVISKGVFVRFGDEGFEGFLPARRLEGWWDINGLETALVAAESGQALRIGDPVEVSVERVDAARGRVDLWLQG
jgi:ribonuclease R